MKKLKLFLTLLMALFVSVGSMWAETKICTFSGSGTVSTSSVTINSVTWNIATGTPTGSPTIAYGNAYSKTSIKFGSGASNCYASVTLSTNYFKNGTKKVTKVEVEAIGSAARNVTFSAGGKNTTKSVASNSWTMLTLDELEVTDVLSLDFALNGAGFFIHEITVTYEDYVPNTPTISANPDSIGFGLRNIYNNDAAKKDSATIEVTGANLETTITAALDFHSNFSLSANSLPRASNKEKLKVYYDISAAGSYNDTLRLTSTNANEVKIPITLKVVNENRVVDTLAQSTTGVTGNSYTVFFAKGACTDAEYSGKCAGNYKSIQLNTTSPNAFYSSFSDGFVRKVRIKIGGNTSNSNGIDVYGVNTVYESSADLFDNSKRGTKLGSFTKSNSNEIDIEGDYKYIGFVATGGAVYIDTAFVTWAPATKDAISISECVGGEVNVTKKANGSAVADGESVAQNKKLIVKATPSANYMGGTIKVVKTADPEVDVTASVMVADTLTMPAYPITISATFTPRPRVSISPKSRNFQTVEQGDEVASRTFTITGYDLTGELTIKTPTGYNVSLNSGSLTPDDGVVNATMNIIPVTTNFGTFNGKIYVNGGGLGSDTAQVDVKMTVIAKSAVTITPPANGVITVKDANNEDVASDARIVVGKRMKVTVAPNDPTTHRETLKIYKTDDEETTISVDENDSITMPDYPITIESTEVALFAVALDVKEDGAAVSHGTSATMDGGTATLYKAAGETVTLVATRATGYQFDKWTTSSTDIVIAAADSTKTSITATINGAGTITANFRAVPELLVSTTALDLEYAKLDSALDAKTFTISGESLTAGKLTLALDEAIKDAFTLSDYSIDVDGTLAEKTITVTPVTSVAGEFSGNLTISGGGLAAVKTVALTSEIEQTYKITWIVNGEETSLTDIAGTALVAPSAGTISGKTVMGWTDAAITTKTDTKPTIVTLTTMPTKDSTLYALYATQSSKDSVLTFSYTFTPSDFATGGYSSDDDEVIEATCTTDNKRKVEVEYSTISIMNQSSYIQGAKNAGKIFNTTPWGKQVKSVTIVNGGTGSNFSKGIGSSEKPTSVGTGAYFQVYVSSGFCTASSFTVTFDSTINVTTYNAYVTRGYAVTIADGIEHGTVTIKNGTTSVESGSLVAYGTTLTVEAEPESDQYILSSLLANTTDIKDAMSFTMGNEAVTIVAEFIDKSTVGIDNTEVGGKAVKVLRNGILLIEKNGRTYNAMGQLVK